MNNTYFNTARAEIEDRYQTGEIDGDGYETALRKLQQEIDEARAEYRYQELKDRRAMP